MKSADWDTVAPLQPLDRVAGQVSSKGEHFEANILPTTVISDVPIPTRNPTVEERKDPGFRDLAGVRMGRLTVKGIAKDIKSNNRGQAWVVRCVCGNYEIRRTPAIKQFIQGRAKSDDEPCCSWCVHTRRLQQGRGKGIPQQHGTREGQP